MEPFQRGVVHPSAVVSPSARLGVGVTVGPFTVINAGVEIGDGSTVGSHCVIGESLRHFYEGDDRVEATIIGAGSLVRSHSVIYQDVVTGPGVRTGNGVLLREGVRIGEDVQIGANCELHNDVSLGDHVRLQSNVGFAPGTLVEDFAWILARVFTANDPHPPSDTCWNAPRVCRYAVVASQAILMPGVVVGEHALVGAASLVNRDVPPETVVIGTPAKAVGSVRDLECREGNLDAVYPWPLHYRRGYPEGALPEADQFR